MDSAGGERPGLPLFARYPALTSLPHVALGVFPTPVERLQLPGTAAQLWVKRDDLTAPAFGGNKVRALEFLLATVRPGDTVLTVGGEGSTHVLTTAAHARALGANTIAVRWLHEMNPVADAVAVRARDACTRIATTRGAISGMLRAIGLRLSERVHWVPAGGTSPLGMLGHVNAALELAQQIEQGLAPRVDRIVVPLGSGGTLAGLALGVAIAGLDIALVGARVVPRVIANRTRVLALARATARLIERVTGEAVPRLGSVEVVHEEYGGAYGRATAAGSAAEAALHTVAGIRLDATYSAKALAAVLNQRSNEPVLFWLTFDARWLSEPS